MRPGAKVAQFVGEQKTAMRTPAATLRKACEATDDLIGAASRGAISCSMLLQLWMRGASMRLVRKTIQIPQSGLEDTSLDSRTESETRFPRHQTSRSGL